MNYDKIINEIVDFSGRHKEKEEIMSVRKIPKNRITKDGRSYAFIVTEYGLDGKRHQHQSKAYMTYEEALRAE